MTTISQSDTHLTYAAIDAHVRAQLATTSTESAPTAQLFTPPWSAQAALETLLPRYHAIRPILAALAAIPLIPPAWRAGLIAFVTATDEVAKYLEAPRTSSPAPIPINPDFKAGKDQ